MFESDVKYKKVDKWVFGEVKKIKLIGEDDGFENGKHYFVFWHNHNDESRATNVSHKELFDWFRIDQTEFDKKYESKIKINEKKTKKPIKLKD